MKNGPFFTAVWLLAIFFLPHAHAAESVQIQTRVIQSDKTGGPFSEKAFSFLVQKQKPQGQSPSCVAGILLPDQLKKIASLGVRLSDVTLQSGQKGTVLYTWNVNAPSSHCVAANGAKNCPASEWSRKAGIACTYVPRIRRDQVDLKAGCIDKQFVGFLQPSALSGKVNKKLTAELNEKSHKPIAVFTVKEINANVELRDGQTLVIYVSKTKSARHKYLLVTIHTVAS